MLTINPFLEFDVDKGQADERRVVHLVVQLGDDAIIAAGYGDRRLVTLHLADAVKLSHTVSL